MPNVHESVSVSYICVKPAPMMKSLLPSKSQKYSQPVSISLQASSWFWATLAVYSSFLKHELSVFHGGAEGFVSENLLDVDYVRGFCSII